MLIWVLLCHYGQMDVGSGNTIHQVKYVNRDLRQESRSEAKNPSYFIIQAE